MWYQNNIERLKNWRMEKLENEKIEEWKNWKVYF